MRWLTFGFLNCAEISPLELVDVAAGGGFTSVGLRITGRRLADPYPRVVGNPGAISAIRERLAARQLRLSNISAYHLYPEVGMRKLIPLVDTAAALRSEMILVSCYDPDHTRFCATMREYAGAAAERRLRLAIEFVPFSCAKSLGDACAIVDAVDRENFGMIVDPLHLARSGGRPEDLAKVAPDRLFFAQLCDGLAEKPANVDLATEARTLRRDPGTGGLRMAEILGALPGNLELECEFPTSANLALPPAERARTIRDAATAFLAGYDQQRVAKA